MAIIKCKMCGGELILVDGASTAECEFCGSVQTIPNLDDEKKLIQFERAERLRKQCEFDKAAGIYETIVADYRQEAEAYWGLVLCKYGIEYVDDPATGKKIPTCHRSSFDSILDDSDFEQACENADAVARKIYREEAKQIEELRKGIIEVSGKEEPYDIFICYKETAENGERTIDSVIAQDVYDALTAKGYRVFFARITLEDKLGQEYEPYIFAALNSAKIMLAFGTDYEYFNAVWVKNEWSRFLKLMAKDKSKHLIPCYKDIDAYDMPKEFARLQAQDLGKVGAIQDLLRGIEKILPKASTVTVVQERVVIQGRASGSSGSPDAASLLKRAFMFLEDADWKSANEYCEKVLDIDPENARAYVGKLMAELCVRTQEGLKEQAEPFDQRSNFQKAIRFGDAAVVEYLNGVITHIKQRNEKAAAEQAVISKRKSEELAPVRERIKAAQHCIEAGGSNCLGVNINGTVKSIDDQDVYNKWNSIVAVSVELNHTVGLRSNGTVVAWGVNYFGMCNVSGWKNIIAVSAGRHHTVGLKADGTVVATQYDGDHYRGQCDVSGWTDIVAVSAGSDHTVGLKSDGTVVAVGNKQHGKCDVSGWTNIVAISAGGIQTFGLKADGTVVATGGYHEGTSGWTDIVAIDARSFYPVGLKADGTVVVADSFGHSGWDISGWTDIVAVSVGIDHIVGLKSDGTVVAAGKIKDCKISHKVANWRLFNSVDTIEQERKEYAKRKKEEVKRKEEQEAKRREEEAKRKKEQEEREKQMAAWRASGKCQHCGGDLKGLFSKKCASCGRSKDY